MAVRIPTALARLIPPVIAILALAEAACDNGPTRPPQYSPFPQHLFSPSATATHIYFEIDGATGGPTAGIYRVSTTGATEAELVTPGLLSLDPTVSPDGTRLAYTKYGCCLIIRDLISDTEYVAIEADVVWVDWFNDDTILCDILESGIVLLALSSGETTPLTGPRSRFAAASSNGEIVFFEYLPSPVSLDSSVLYSMPALGETPTRIASFTHVSAHYPRWHPDLPIITFSQLGEESVRITTLDRTSGLIKDSVVTGATDGAFAPDGRIVFVKLGDKSKGQNDAIGIMNFDGTDLQIVYGGRTTKTGIE